MSLLAQFATEQRLAVLKTNLLRLKHEDSETPFFFPSMCEAVCEAGA